MSLLTLSGWEKTSGEGLICLDEEMTFRPPDSLNIVQPRCHSHSLTVCANHSSSAELLQQVVARAEAMYKTNAYLHWYWRYGCEEEDFQQAFETLCSVADDYSRLGE
ncbi:hypothetical protein KIL84_011712 [Mauremys mutica]|uniref:Uncharacterized protein n=1 Tax=Mauremys mutica TaxID=74926 RepID=A0A9D3XFB3_9SAUR|nr:hypothetical protein KIL84_011712 [Mauremys mutica]